MEQTRIGRSRQFVGERLRLFGGHIEPEHFYGDKAIACGFVSTEHRTQRANTNLMQDPERSECRWWNEGSRIVSGHSGEGRKNVAQIVPHPKLKRGILSRCRRVELPQSLERRDSAAVWRACELSPRDRLRTVRYRCYGEPRRAREDASERSEATHAIGASRRSGSRESVLGSPRGEASRVNTKRLARARVGESEGRSPSGKYEAARER